MKCPRCNEEKYQKAGWSWRAGSRVQRWRCTTCGKTYTELGLYMIQARDSRGNWDESAVSRASEDNTFDSEGEAREMIPELVRVFQGDDPPPTADDFRVVKRLT